MQDQHPAPLPTPPFSTVALPLEPTVTAPDGSDVRVLAGVRGGSMAHFALAPGRCSAAVQHKTVEELWYVLSGEARCGAARASAKKWSR